MDGAIRRSGMAVTSRCGSHRAMALLPICDSPFTCEDYNTFRAHSWSPSPLRRAYQGPGRHRPRAALREEKDRHPWVFTRTTRVAYGPVTCCLSLSPLSPLSLSLPPRGSSHNWRSTAVERRGNTLKGCKDIFLKAKARLWP